MRTLIVLAAWLCGPMFLPAAEAQKSPNTLKKSSAPKKTTTASKKTATAKKNISPKKTSSKSRLKKTRVASWRTGQRTPTPQRYTEIQEALIAKGYLPPPATGVWGAGSVEALKRFQQDQNLTASGKLDALSLIALGLGPRRESPIEGGSPPPAAP